MKTSLPAASTSLAPPSFASAGAITRLPRTVMSGFFQFGRMALFTTAALAQTPPFPDPAWTAAEVPRTTLTAIDIQPDGKVVAAGYANVEREFVLVRFALDGSVDASFGSDGIVTTPTGPGTAYAWGVAVAQNGRIYAAGDAGSLGGSRGFAVVRYLDNGTPDPAFGVAGIVMYTPAGFTGFTAAGRYSQHMLALQPDGKVLVMGQGYETSAAPTTNSAVIIRLNPEGTIDQTFGTNGQIIIPLNGVNGFVNAMRLSADGSIFVAGSEAAFNGGFIIKLDPAGNPDPGFGSGGKLGGELTNKIFATDLAIQVDNKIVAVGRQWGPGNKGDEDGLAIFRLHPDGAFDNTFGDGGTNYRNMSSFADYATAVAIESSGNIVVTINWSVSISSYAQFILARLTPDGQPDAKFGSGGFRLLAAPAAFDIALDDAGAAYLLNTHSSTIEPLPSGQTFIQKYTILFASDAPAVAIFGGARNLVDTDGVAGELVHFSGTAVDPNGTIVSTAWLLDGVEAGAGTSLAVALDDGTTIVSFSARDNHGNITTTSVTYTVHPPTASLPRISSYSSQRTPGDSEFSIAIRTRNNVLIDEVAVGEPLGISGFIFPQAADQNSPADIFVVAVTPSGWFMRNLDGLFIPWNGVIADLVPAYEDEQLTAQVRALIYEGVPGLPGTYGLYLGYMRTDTSELIYTANAAEVELTP